MLGEYFVYIFLTPGLYLEIGRQRVTWQPISGEAWVKTWDFSVYSSEEKECEYAIFDSWPAGHFLVYRIVFLPLFKLYHLAAAKSWNLLKQWKLICLLTYLLHLTLLGIGLDSQYVLLLTGYQ